MYEVIFLLILALIWIVFAIIQDLRKREIANWLNFSLIVFALGFRFFYSLFSSDNFVFFYQGLIGLVIFLVLGNLLYYSKAFAGGDAKLMIALGAILPIHKNFLDNIEFFSVFFIIFLFVGAAYSLVGSLILSLKNFKEFRKEFSNQLKKNKKFIIPIFVIALLIMILGFLESIFFFIGILIFILPYMYIYAKAVDESCMIKRVKTSKLTEGDWLYKDVRVGQKVIKATWDGLRKQDITQLKKKHKFVLIRQGIPFSPAFLISFLILIYFWQTGIWDFLI